MQVNISGRHTKIPDETEDYIREKAERLQRFFAGLQHVDVVVSVEGNPQQIHVEMSATLIRGVQLIGKGEATEMNAAIDVAESRLRKQIRRFHARLKDHRDRTRIGQDARPAAEAEEDTYEQIVQEMLEEEES